jgi:serine/threonine protein kinase/tetratricopeptide (TPR) repeat protein
MTTEPPRTLAAIVDEAQKLPPDDQLRFLKEACATDPSLYQSAVDHLQSRQGWFDDSIDIDPEPTEIPPDPAGERIGAYRIVRSLGQGGMGEVFLAERADDQFSQQVAIKLVRRGLLSRHIQGRLRLERQILATLDHPNIARLFDGGTTTEGTPYIVMEYIDGEPIDTYCDRRNLSVEARLKLFQTVCSAVHRAHQNLIVHRDLKPSNILVTADGTPKLLDFGIAKLLDERQMMHTMAVTQADYRVMTPDHASPEQIQGGLITTASDIYVLGVLLYELLSGFKPFATRGNRLGELERAICEDDALAPSAAIKAARDSGHSAIEQLAVERATTPPRLQRQLSGDLDNIVAMAMRKEPERRYSSVEQLAADVDRHLRGMPVLARADSWTYRTSKFAQRHGVVVGFSTALFALLIGFSVTTQVQSKRIERERDVAEMERATAQAERERAEAVSEFLIESFQLAGPLKARGDTITAKEILDGSARRISNELRNQPALQATLMDTMGIVYLNLGQPDDAQPLIEQSLSIRRALFGPDNLDVARSLLSLNRVYGERGELRRAEDLARESLNLTEKHAGSDSLETAINLCQLGVLERTKGETAMAEQLLQRCLDIRIARLGRENEQVADTFDNLAQIATDRQDYVTAERLHREALAIDGRVRDETHPRYIRHVLNLASVLQAKGDLAAARPLFRNAIDLYERVLGRAHPETIDAMNAYGRLLVDEGQLEEAQNLYQAVLEADRKLRPNHYYVGYDLASLGRLAWRKKEYPRAETHLRQALDVYEKTLPPDHIYIAGAWMLLGRVFIDSKRAEEAETALAHALAIWSKEYDKNKLRHATSTALLGQSWAMQGRMQDAERALTESYPIIAASNAAGDVEMSRQVQGWIEELYRRQNRPLAAQEYFARVQKR